MDRNTLLKLPKYAQDYIRGLEGELKQFKEELEAQKQTTPSRVFWGRSYRDIAAGGFLRDDETIHFIIGSNPRRDVRVRLTKDGNLYINGDDRLSLTFEATNACTIMRQP